MKKNRGRPMAFPPRERRSLYCTPEEAAYLRKALEEKRKREQQHVANQEQPTPEEEMQSKPADN